MPNEVNIDKISIEVETMAQNAIAPLTDLANTLNALKGSLSGLGELNSFAKSIQTLNNNTGNLRAISADLQSITSAAGALSASVPNIQGLNDFTKTLKNLGNIDSAKITASLDSIKEAVTSLENSLPATPKINQLAASLSQLSPALSNVSSNLNSAGTSAKASSSSFKQLFNIGAAVVALRKLTDGIGKAITKSTDFVENLNLFAVEMGNGAEQADKFVANFSKVLGLDPSNVMRYMGFFQQLTEGVGLASDMSQMMSKNITQLGYDMSSFLNIPVDQAMKKFESGLNGISKPLRSVGINLTQTALQAKLLDMGFNVVYKDLSEQTKVQLRYIQIMDSTRKMQGDLARTMLTPANALRILQEQVYQTSRALGNMFIPAITRVIPYIIAFLQVIAEMANALAELFGFKLPKIDYSTLEATSTGMDDIAESASDATKELKRFLAPFDELNVISENAAGNLDKVGGLNLDFGDLNKYDYDATFGAISESVDKIKASIKDFIDVAKNNPIIKALGEAFGWLWDNAIKPLGKWISENPDLIMNMLIGIGSVLLGGKLALEVVDMGKSLLKLILTNPQLFAIGLIGTTIAAVGMAIWTASEDIRKADLAKRFGDIVLSAEEVKKVAESLTTSELTIQLDIFMEEKSKLEPMKKAIEADIAELNKYNWMISIGMQLTPDQITAYKNTIDKFVKDIDDYIVQKHYVATLAIDLLLGGTEYGKELQQFADTFYSENREKLNSLGKELRDTVDKAFADGVISPEEAKTITNLQKEMQEIINKVSEADYEAKFQSLQLDFAGTKLTSESFQDVMAKANDIIEDQLKGLGEAKITDLSIAYQQLHATLDNAKATQEERKIAQDVYDGTVKEIQAQFEQKSVDLGFKTFEFGMNTLNEAFTTELETYRTGTTSWINDFYSSAVAEGFKDSQGNIETSAEEWIGQLNHALSHFRSSGVYAVSLTPEIKKNMQEVIDNFKPTQEQYAEIAKNSLAAGKSVPENIAKGLNDVNELAAIAGIQASTNYNIGKMLSTDQSFLELLATSEDAGKALDSNMALGLAANIGIVTDKTTGMITAIKNTATGEITKITPTLTDNLKTLGINVADGLLQGATTEMQDNKKHWYDIFGNIGTWFANLFGIHSPSRVFSGYGENIIEGLTEGVDKEMPIFTSDWNKNLTNWWNEKVAPWFTLDKWKTLGNNALLGLMQGLSNIGTKISTWGSNFVGGIKKFFGIQSPSTLFRDQIGENLALGIGVGFDKGINDVSKQIKSDMQSLVTAASIEPVITAKVPQMSMQDICPPQNNYVAVIDDQAADAETTEQTLRRIIGSSNNSSANSKILANILEAIQEKRTITIDGRKFGEEVNSSQNRSFRQAGKTLVKM